jgi:integrase
MISKIRLPQGERTREFVLSREQEPVYLNAAPQPLKDLALLMLDTGLRDGEALALKWPDVHMQPAPTAEFGDLQVQKGKSVRARRTVSLTARVQTMLAARPEKSSPKFVFPSRTGKPMLLTSLDHLHAKVPESLKMPADFVVHSITSHGADPARYAGCGCFHNYENRRPQQRHNFAALRASVARVGRARLRETGSVQPLASEDWGGHRIGHRR